MYVGFVHFGVFKILSFNILFVFFWGEGGGRKMKIFRGVKIL